MVHIYHYQDGSYETLDGRPEIGETRAERNALKVVELEKEWALSGPLREIRFITSFRDESGVDAFAANARTAGFSVEVEVWSGDTIFTRVITATKFMPPSYEEITKWEEWFINEAEKAPEYLDPDGYMDPEPGAKFTRWAYPAKFRPTFRLNETDYRRKKLNLSGKAATARTRILFGERMCDFEASNGWADKNGARNLGRFQLVPSEFIKAAERRQPKNPEPTASGFSQWLYSLYSSAFGSHDDRERGREAEEYILQARTKAFSSFDGTTMREKFPGWRLRHNGMQSSEGRQPQYFEIGDLLVRGQPLRVLPDLIFENQNTGAHLIVEVKHSYMTIPDNLWPNIWGQLWCYSQMQRIKQSPEVIVVGEVWGDRIDNRAGTRDVYLRACVRRNPRTLAFDRFFRVLFDIYRGAS